MRGLIEQRFKDYLASDTSQSNWFKSSFHVSLRVERNENEPRGKPRGSNKFRRSGYCDGGDAASQARTESRLRALVIGPGLRNIFETSVGITPEHLISTSQ